MYIHKASKGSKKSLIEAELLEVTLSSPSNGLLSEKSAEPRDKHSLCWEMICPRLSYYSADRVKLCQAGAQSEGLGKGLQAYVLAPSRQDHAVLALLEFAPSRR
jgi:hypothetical protein